MNLLRFLTLFATVVVTAFTIEVAAGIMYCTRDLKRENRK